MYVAVVRGGPSGEHEVSLKTGEALKACLLDKHDVLDVIIDRDGTWRANGAEITCAQVCQVADMVVNALHGEYGEDGQIQKEFENVHVPFTGSGSVESKVAMNKYATKLILEKHDTPMPKGWLVKQEDDISEKVEEIYQQQSSPYVVKPCDAGSSLGVTLAQTTEQMKGAIEKAREVSLGVLVEEYIEGVEATCGVFEDFRGEDIYVLPPVEIRSKNSFFDYEAKYGGGTEEICPGRFSEKEKRAIQHIARTAHMALGLRHYSRTDMIVHPKRGVFFLETNTLPGMTTESLFPKSLRAVGSGLDEFVEHLLTLATKRS